MAKAGNPSAHDSAVAHVTGQARYVDDMEASVDQLHIALGLTTIARGRLVSLDLEPVKRAAGVVDVMRFSDLDHATDIGPVFPGDPLFVENDISFYGQTLFAVAAMSQQAARKAILLADVQYEEQAPELELSTSISEKRFVRPPHRMQRGNADAAIAAAPHRLQGEFSIGGQEHFYLEGQVARAQPDEQGGVTVWSSNQNPTEAQHLIAKVLGIPMHRVNVIVRRMGGGFGGKETHANACAVYAALFALRQQRSVSCRLSRRDDMLTTGKRHGFLNSYEVGFDNDGRILGVQHQLAGQCGHSPDLSDAIVDRAMFHCDNAYYYPDVRIDGLRCHTHTVSNTAFRGFGGPQGMLAAETVIDEIAFALGKDPLMVRKLNFYDDKSRNTTPYHQTVTGFTVPRLFDELERSANYQERRAAIATFNNENPVLKKGLAMTPVKFGISFTVKHLNQAGALIHLYSDGSVQLNHGGTEMGQGLMTKVQQIVASALGMRLDRIAIMATRTDKVPNTSATAASAGTDLNGMAALAAAHKIKQRLIQYLADKHTVDKSAIRFANDAVTVKGNGDVGEAEIHYTWPELADQSYRDRISLSATGYYRTPKIHYDRDAAKGRPFYYFANGAAVTEVVIDTLTGETRVLRADLLHDVGRSINPAIDLGQVEGGYVQGLGWLTHEELCWDGNGRLTTDGPATYKIPTAGDMPVEFNVALLKDSPNDEATVFHSKAVGEPPLMLAISGFAAIRDAIGSVAQHQVFPELNAPATPEEVLRTIEQVRQVSSTDNDGQAS